MSVVSLIAHNYTVFQKALIFLMKLAWKSRIRLPYLIMIGFMMLNPSATCFLAASVLKDSPPMIEDHHSHFMLSRENKKTDREFDLNECQYLQVLDVRVTLEIVVDIENQTSEAHEYDTIETSSDSEDQEH